MTRSAAFLVVAVLLCIVLPATASDVLRCTGERQRDGQFYFNMTYDLKEGVDDCETQWVINGSVVGISDADGITECMLPLLNATANTAILQTCHENLECLLICPSAGINKKESCSCNITSPTTLPEGKVNSLCCSTNFYQTINNKVCTFTYFLLAKISFIDQQASILFQTLECYEMHMLVFIFCKFFFA
ncbi:uncharacterized protein LOC131521373 isoform X3 [Onychostoma macrolepis]|uniref:uncharacterized protein LOC131521373 isoform X3 n=1 Tax=Onychostoma macrolepis TaxID=369639 RepID=UPI002729E500|nr:uncharacterized protein LOC131521373 isoform X3 [Onychostoma macrolepis]